MNHDTGSSQNWQHRAAVVAIAVAGIALLVTACGGSSSSAVGKPRAYQKAFAYAQCMRANGESGFPDPTSSGTFIDTQINLNSSQYISATSACQNLRPAGVYLQMSAAQKQELLTGALKLAACMRAHGITNFPDPGPQTVVDNGKVVAVGIGRGIPPSESNSPLFQSALKACGGPSRAPAAPGGGGS